MLWFDHRFGRITASVMGKVSKCREDSFPNSLFKKIMQYSKPNIDVPALNWRHLNEEKASQKYCSIASVQYFTLILNTLTLVQLLMEFSLAIVVVKVSLKSSVHIHIGIL